MRMKIKMSSTSVAGVDSSSEREAYFGSRSITPLGKTMIQIKEETSVSSNSTDYGLDHGAKIISKKVKLATKKGISRVESKIGHVFEALNISRLVNFDLKRNSRELSVDMLNGERDSSHTLDLERGMPRRTLSSESTAGLMPKKKVLRKMTTMDVLDLSKHRIPKRLRGKVISGDRAEGDIVLAD